MLKLMIDIILDVEYSALRSMIQILQTMRLKYIPGENVATGDSYLKGALMLLQSCEAFLTGALGLLNDIMTSADCDDLTEYMKNIYFASKHNRSAPASSFTDYLNTVESEYRTLYRAGKRTKSKADPDSGFYAGNPRNATPNPDKDANEGDTSMVGADEGRGLGSRRGRGRRGDRGGRGRGRGFQRKRCYNCGTEGHVERNCWAQGSGSEGERPSSFPDVNDVPVDPTAPPG